MHVPTLHFLCWAVDGGCARGCEEGPEPRATPEPQNILWILFKSMCPSVSHVHIVEGCATRMLHTCAHLALTPPTPADSCRQAHSGVRASLGGGGSQCSCSGQHEVPVGERVQQWELCHHGAGGVGLCLVQHQHPRTRAPKSPCQELNHRTYLRCYLQMCI